MNVIARNKSTRVKQLRGPWRITFDTNPDTCNYHCIMCEEHSHYRVHENRAAKSQARPRLMPIELIRQVVEEAAAHGLKEIIPSTMGEPLLYPEIVSAIHEKAATFDIDKRQVITNGYWTKDKSRARKIAKLLASSGVNHVAISVDAFHQECIPLDMVRYSAEALLESGITNIKWNPCWLVSSDAENRHNSKTRIILKELEDLSIPISQGNVVEPDGRAMSNLSEYFERKRSFPGISCQDMPYLNRLDDIQSICIEPNGDIPICKAFTIGNAKGSNTVGILESYDPYSIPEIKDILNKDVQGFVEGSKKMGIQLEEWGYYTICDLCCSVWKQLDAKS